MGALRFGLRQSVQKGSMMARAKAGAAAPILTASAGDKVVVTVDGAPVADFIYADATLGVVLCHVRDDDGTLVMNPTDKTQPLGVQRNGAVEITRPAE